MTLGWSAFLFRTTTGDVGPQIQISEGGTWNIPLNDVESFKVTAIKSALPPVDSKWLEPLYAGILLKWNDVPIVGGPMISNPEETENTLSIDCRGMRHVLGSRTLTKELTNWSDLATSVIQYNGYSLGTIAKLATQQAMAKRGGALPISFPIPDEAAFGSSIIPADLPPCTHEDGSGQTACYWDASKQGNGQGVSYAVINGQTIYANDQGHLRTYRGFNLSNLYVDDVLTKLSEVIDGPDILFRPRMLSDNKVTFDLLTGTERDPRIHQEYMPMWDTSRPDSAAKLKITNTGAYLTNRVYSTGAGQDESIIIEVIENEGSLLSGYPLLEKVVSSSNSEDRRVVRQHGMANLVQNSKPLQEITLVVRADGNIKLGQFWTGNSVQLIVNGYRTIKDGIHKARLLTMSGSFDNNVTLSLQLED